MDSALPGITATLNEPRASACAEITGDQAVFTSVRTPMSEGYRLIAASAGLTAAEKTEIAKRSPSHDGLCGSDDRATAVAFYKLPGGRLCVALSRTAGLEPSGRGGLRVYTWAFVFDSSSFDAFAYDPFNVLRAAEACGLGAPELKPEETLPVVQLSTNRSPGMNETAAAISGVGVDWLSYVLQAAYQGQRVILAGEEDARGVIEAALLGLPRSMRQDVSFACGLKFSIGRGFTLIGVTGDMTATERIIRGHPLTLVRPQAAAPPPPYDRSEWPRMVAEYWTEAAYEELQEFTGQEFPDCTLSALERIAALRKDTSRASVAGPAELLALAERRLTHVRTDPLERRLLADLLGTIRLRLEQVWTGATEVELTAAWPTLVACAAKSPQAFRFAVPLIGSILRRLAATAPTTALERALDVPGKETLRTIGADLRAVLEATQR
ncbi:MAG: hypothetical protein V2A79_15700 [Planctomycetota bacterium]